MVLKLDPRIPAVWRDPFSLQFGVSHPVAVLRDVSAAAERMIAALSGGISRSGLEMIAQASGAADGELDTLLSALFPALAAEEPGHVPTVLIAGVGRTAQQLTTDLAAADIRVRVAHSPQAAASEECDLAIIVSAFVIAPEYHALWLRRDVPHLPIVIGDDEVVIGPLVEPGVGPCLHCLNRYHTDADASWPAIAAQLLGRQSAAESPLVASEAAALAARLVTHRLGQPAPAAFEELSLDMASGRVRSRTRVPHPECGCISLDAQPSLDR